MDKVFLTEEKKIKNGSYYIVLLKQKANVSLIMH